MKTLPKYQPYFSPARLILHCRACRGLKRTEAVRFYRIFGEFLEKHKQKIPFAIDTVYYFFITSALKKYSLPSPFIKDILCVNLSYAEFKKIVYLKNSQILVKKFQRKEYSFYRKNTPLFLPDTAAQAPLKAVFFKNIFTPEGGKEQGMRWIYLGTWKLISQLRRRNIRIVLSEYKFSEPPDKFEKELMLNSNADFIGISLFEKNFLQAQRLVARIKKKSKVLVGIGGPMPTYAPEYVMAHLEGANFIVRGEGEDIIIKIMQAVSLKKEDTKEGLLFFQWLSSLDGIMYFNNNVFITGNLSKINYLEKTGGYELDFSFLSKDSVASGVNLFTSRGCPYFCSFCTIVGRRYFRAQDLNSIAKELKEYQKTLIGLYGKQSEVPVLSWGLSFYDDDFLLDTERAIALFKFIKNSPFYINFFQASINSFYLKKNNKFTGKLNGYLIENITPDVFLPKQDYAFALKRFFVYIGTENFSDRELQRLGKGYGFERIYKVTEALSRNKIYQAHHFIVANSFTQWQDLLDNFQKISALKEVFGEYFEILCPPIFNLTSLFPTVSYEKIRRLSGRYLESLKVNKILKKKYFPEMDYCLVDRDEPADCRVNSFIMNFKRILKDSNYLAVFKEILNGHRKSG